MSFTKLHGTILDSSVWAEGHATRILWITMLAMADENGIVEASVSGLSRRAVVSIEECNQGLAVLSGPDPDSRDGTSGERIEKVPGGWLILNHVEYRDKRTQSQIDTAARVRRHRLKKSGKQEVTCNNVTNVTPGNDLPPSEAEAEADKDPPNPPLTGGACAPSVDPKSPDQKPSDPKPPKKPKRDRSAEHPLFSKFWEKYPLHENRIKALAAFTKIDPSPELLETILAAISAQRVGGCLQNRKTPDGRSTIPHPSTWLNGRRWEDEVTPARPQRTEAPVNAETRRQLERMKAEAADPATIGSILDQMKKRPPAEVNGHASPALHLFPDPHQEAPQT